MYKHCDELDILKFWGILLVVLGHVTNMWTPGGIVHPVVPSDTIGFISSFVYLFHMPLFVFLSGCVYAYQCEVQERKTTFIDLITKKSKRLLIPYLVFGVFLVLLMVGCGFRNDIVDYAYNGVLLSKDSRHLWFVMMLFEVFVLFWVMNKVIDKLRLPKCSILIVSFVCYLFANRLPYILQISSAFRYFFWFTLGYVFILYKNVIRTAYIYASGGVILTLNLFIDNEIGKRIPLMSTITAFIGIMFFYQISCDIKSIEKYKVYQVISKDSFGIYLYHVFFIYLLFYFLADIAIPPYVLCPLVFVVSLVMSIVMTELTRKLGLHIFIGEKRPHAE